MLNNQRMISMHEGIQTTTVKSLGLSYAPCSTIENCQRLHVSEAAFDRTLLHLALA